MDTHETKTAVKVEKAKMAEQQNTEAANAVGEEKKQEPVIYLGPYLRRIATPGTVLVNGLTPALEKAKKENPAIGELLVPLSKAVGARKQIEVKGSSMNLIYQNVKNFKYSEVMK